MSPTIQTRLLSLSLSFLLLPPCEDKIASDYSVPLPVSPKLALMPRYLPLLLILRTTRHLTTQTSVSLFLSLRSYILSLSLASSLSLLALRASISLISTYNPAPTCSIVHLSRAFTSRKARSSLLSVLHGRRLRRVLCSFRQFNATMSRERPTVRPSRQSSRQIITPRFFRNFVSHYSSAEFGIIELANG